MARPSRQVNSVGIHATSARTSARFCRPPDMETVRLVVSGAIRESLSTLELREAIKLLMSRGYGTSAMARKLGCSSGTVTRHKRAILGLAPEDSLQRKVCTICDKRHYSLGFCKSHYEYYKNYGDPLLNRQARIEKRFQDVEEGKSRWYSPWTDLEFQEVDSLREAGWTLREIARKLGRTHQGIQKAIQRKKHV